MFNQLDKVKYNCSEYIITIFGKSMMEWHVKGLIF